MERPTPLAEPTDSVRNGDIDIFYSRHGKGQLLVLLHGFPDHEGTYAAQVADLDRDYLVVTPRLRGYPPSSVPIDVERYALPAIAEDIAALIRHFDQGPAILVGHDWGGMLARAVVMRFPNLVKGLILLNAPTLSTFRALVNSDPEQQALSAYTLRYLHYQPGDAKNVSLRNIRDPGWRSTISSYLDANPIEGMVAYYKANYPAPPYHVEEPAGYTFALPTLIIWGTEETYFASSVLDGLAIYFPASLRLVTVPGAGHWVHHDAPDRVNKEIRSWLAMLSTIEECRPESRNGSMPSSQDS